MDLEVWQARLRAFAAERDWARYHSPKNLAMALTVEAAELQELFQWDTEDGSRAIGDDARRHAALADEVADVALLLLQLADATGVDIENAMEAKLIKNARKHPASTAPEL